MNKAIWLSYDLGVEGDYQGLYRWLDKNKAVECGDSLAYFVREIHDSSSLTEVIKEELKSALNLSKKDRIYIIYRSGDKKVRGMFLFGGRTTPPWHGFSSGGEIDTIDTLDNE